MLTVAECAGRACVCESIVRSWISSGRLPHFRVGAAGKRGKILVQVEDLDGLMASFKVEGRGVNPSPQPVRQAVLKHLRQPS